ncbi:MAG: hypothetical protein GC162_05345 [Planctomycetes bacterium]|nr:hypothetical protein [Planctomycetota bacterium]
MRSAGRSVRYPDLYTWFVFLSALDVMCTWIVLKFGGAEVNFLAQWIIHLGGLWGMIAFKFLVVTLVLFACEYVGRRNAASGRRVATWAVALNALPVILALSMLTARTHGLL